MAPPPTALPLDERTAIVNADALAWLAARPERSVHAVVTDPPYGLAEFEEVDLAKLRAGRGGRWRIPPTLDGVRRAPVPRFTVLTPAEITELDAFFRAVAVEIHRVLVPGGHVMVASNPLVCSWTFDAFAAAGLERRGMIVRGVQTLRGGDRPKGAHEEFTDTTVLPRSCWEPWGLFRKRCEGTVRDNLRSFGTGALRRPSSGGPFKDLIACAPARGAERAAAPHPSLKPQRFLRKVVRASLPLGEGIVLDPFAGSGSTLAAASAVGYRSIGVERDATWFEMAVDAFPKLRDLAVT
jgi:site-specific DNA-methyltransferase (adenine-specific)